MKKKEKDKEMGLNRRKGAASVKDVNSKLYLQFLLGIFLIFVARSSLGLTNPGDGEALFTLCFMGFSAFSLV